ncbi:hypothetical protein B5F77_11790 [Parabacteroides sp. An277]|uniref:DIP1984 family protein n=1 Tax=Parabacteroides sp. An277 TaxID=1965619 RepID=UPI000B3AA7F1|nr:DIP1984 family protein [Parabacteroides sp. An277]OUO50900.1 hypothetical protein B5F77_11790 [Parabacteroides sp. An277]
MKLAEALSLRADLQKSIAQLKSRLKECSKVQEGDEPSENPEEVLAQLEKKFPELEELIYRINYTNMHTEHEGLNLTQMIAKKDALTLRITALREVLNYVTERESRYSRNEIKYIRFLDVAKLRKQIDSLSQELRLLDMRIQSINWTVDLL